MAAQTEETGLCEHHAEHTEECGYAEGSPCSHEHTEDCYKEETNCVHVHTADCYPEGWAEGEEAEPVNCSHTCSEEEGCITEKLSCGHENNHDEVCGYVEARGCSYVCELCTPEEETADLAPEKDEPVENTEENKENIETPVLTDWKWEDTANILVDDRIIIAKGDTAVTWAEIKAALPASITGTISVDGQDVEKTVAIMGWTHDSIEDIQDETDIAALATEQLVITPELESGYTVAEKPSITIQFTGKATLAEETVSYLDVDAEGNSQERTATATVIDVSNTPVAWGTANAET